jgi:acetyl/propionyl-CoA carboxylase alpha subunit/acetyl-CoA carboxylase carboxyltransferase component
MVANRGEIAVRILHTAATLGLSTVAVHAEDEPDAAWATPAERHVPLPGSGPAAYLDGAALVAAAVDTGCDAVHPGYGFLSERADFARACAAAGLTFVGPSPEALALFGDKAAARRAAAELGVPVPAGSAVLSGDDPAADLAAAREFVASLGPGAAVMVKAVAGGGGRGIRPVPATDAAGRAARSGADDLAEALERCRSEARHGFGDGRLYLERLVPRARHVEVQLLGDGAGSVIVLGDRDCGVQRRRQKLIEIAPAPGLSRATRARLREAATRLGSSVDRLGLATAEFLVGGGAGTEPGNDNPGSDPGGRHGGDDPSSDDPSSDDPSSDDPSSDLGDEVLFLEVNARLQVEHTVTEEATGLDLVELQLQVAGGARLAELGLDPEHPPPARGMALQARVNAEAYHPDGSVRPGAGTLTRFTPPTGRGLRVDTHCSVGTVINPRYDPLLAKVIVSDPAADPDRDGLARVAGRAERALAGFEVAGVVTNLGLLRAVLAHPALTQGPPHTRFLDEHLTELREAAARLDPPPGDAADAPATDRATTDRAATGPASANGRHPDGAITAPLAGVVVSLPTPGEHRGPGAALAVLESMKMEHVVPAPGPVTVGELLVAVGDTVAEGSPLLVVESAEPTEQDRAADAEEDLDRPRPDLAETLERRRGTLDEGRPAAVRERHDKGRRTAREMVADLCDPDTFMEYGALAVAAQRRRRDTADLIARTPGDGMVTGTARIGGLRCAVLVYDYTVLAGTQGVQNHRKTDRLLELARRERIPVVIFAEGGGGRPGDTDQPGFTGLDVPTFHTAAELAGQVPTVAVVGGYCFAGNTALAAVCDVLIVTENSSIGMGGPAMIAGGGLGDVAPGDVGPTAVLHANGVVDLRVADDDEAVATARRYLSYLGGPSTDWTCADQRRLRHLVPENRVRAYPIRPVLELLFDTGSVLELRSGFGAGMITAFARLEGRPVGVFANNPGHLGGAIDADAAEKLARFLRLCDSYRLPVISLCDTPGFMVGPDAERAGLVRRAGEMFVAGAHLSTPLSMVVLRKGYGLGAMAMAGGGLRSTLLAVSWPTGEFGGMNLEGAARLGYRKELEAIADPAAREAKFAELVERAYRHGKALSTATVFDIDDVIDPAETRTVLTRALR